MIDAMLTILVGLLRTLRSALRSHAELAFENLALRQQLSTLRRSSPRPRRPAAKQGKIVELPEVGGLHHRYERRAA